MPYRLFFCLLALLLLPAMTDAAVSDWHFKGASIVPRNQTDFASNEFRQSVANLRATGANTVSLVVPWYQTSVTSHDIQRGENTPTDESLVSAIQYIHSLGMKVILKVHIETLDKQWRANINPSDRAAWFKAYGDMLVHNARIAQAHRVELVSLGTEMRGVSLDLVNPTNTQNWINMIGRVRSAYNGKLTYGAANGDEDTLVKFWPYLDYIAYSPYYDLSSATSTSPSIESIKAEWQKWDMLEVQELHLRYGKPILFGEIGYRNIQNSTYQSWSIGPRPGP
ncbi:MAG TPA: hypothetical protein VEB60_02345, partial [Candidatus Paceibacterota bacterium]|nr:hypothetical protein [Candidatus Paceibacterota bacterium]